MKKKSMFLILSTLLLSVLAISPSSADGCSLEDPCETWAMLDDSNKVINIIVCQPSVCGSGIWDGRKVVRQVASNPNTNDTKNTGGYNSDSNRTVTYNDTSSTFRVSDSRPTETTVIKVQENVTTVISTVISQQPEIKFTYNDTKADPTKPILNQEYKSDTDATISITETTFLQESEDVSVNGQITFENRVTEETAILSILNLFGSDSYLNSLFIDWSSVWGELLSAWFI
jgi:hypothetical protein